MHEEQLRDAILRITRTDNSYHPESYEFIYAVVVNASSGGSGKDKGHISALSLLKCVRRCAFEQFAGLSENVFRSWGINSASDVGKVVFQLVDEKILSVSENDNPADFQVDFDLFELSRQATVSPSQSPRANVIIA